MIATWLKPADYGDKRRRSMEADDADARDAAAMLERVRRLCDAANLIAASALPPLVPLSRVPSQTGSDRRENDERAAEAPQHVSRRPETEKLPLLPSRGGLKPTRPVATKVPAALTEAQRRQREAEKIRQARERAQARIARSNQQEQQLAQQQVEQQRLAAIEAAERYAEKMRLAEEGRFRAQERVRAKRLTVQSSQEREASAIPPSIAKAQTPSTSLVMPRRTRKARPASPLSAAADAGAVGEDPKQAELQETASETEEGRRLRERRIRLETAQRLRRARQIAEEENRRQTDAIQRGLELHRNRQRELDRTAKGLGKREHASSPQSPQESFKWAESETLELTDANGAVLVMEQPPSSHRRPHNQAPYEDVPTGELCPEQLDRSTESFVIKLDDDAGKQSRNKQCEARSKPRRTPPWKRPPVPLLPTECYATKVIIPCSRAISTADSYTEKHKLKQLSHSPSASKCCLGS